MQRIIASKTVYAPVTYLECVTGKCYIGNAVRNGYITYDIDRILKHNGLKFQSFPLNSIERAIKAKKQVVLVDCSHYVGEEYVEEYRWFQVGKDFDTNPQEEE